MNHPAHPRSFPELNRGYARAFQPGKLTLGLVSPIEAYPQSLTPTMDRHLERAQLADQLGFGALWLRDVPFNVPTFGDAGQMFDPFVYLGILAGATRDIGLGTGSIILPLRHPAHVAKAAASADVLSGGRLILGVASGDRPQEYPGMAADFEGRAETFREAFAYIRAMAADYPAHQGAHGTLRGDMDMLPKPAGPRLPLLVTGSSRQAPDWIAEHADGWITYPRDAISQARVIDAYRGNVAALGPQDRPVMQSLYIDLVEDDAANPQPIHLGFRSGIDYLRTYLRALQKIGVNHVAINLRFNQAPVEDTLHRLADSLFPEFPTG